MSLPGRYADRRTTGSYPERFDNSSASATRVIAGGGMRGRRIGAIPRFSAIAKCYGFWLIAYSLTRTLGSSREPVSTSLGNALAAEFGLDLGVEGLGQHRPAGFGLLARAVESDVRHDLGEIAEGKIHRRKQAERRLGHDGRLMRAAERDDLTHRHTHTEGESAFSVRGEIPESG